MLDSVELEKKIEMLVEAASFHLIKANWGRHRGRWLLKVVADAEDHNITVKECADISQTIMDLLDSYPHEFPDYRLEVSSPGLNMPLEKWQLNKNIGRMINVGYSENDEFKTFSGELVSSDHSIISVKNQNESRSFNIENVKEIFVLPSI